MPKVAKVYDGLSRCVDESLGGRDQAAKTRYYPKLREAVGHGAVDTGMNVSV